MAPALAWLVEEVRACNTAVESATSQMGELAQRMAVLEAVERDMGAPIEDSEDLRRRLSWLAGEIQARGDVLTRAADEVDRIGIEMSAVRSQSNDQLANVQARVRQLEVAQGPVGLRHELDRVAAEVTGVPDFAELGRAALRTMELDGSVAGLRQDIERITKAFGGLQQSAMAHVAGRTAPLEGAIHELRQEIVTLAEDIAAARAEGDTQLAEAIEVLGERVVAVEMLPADIEGVRLNIEGLRAWFAQSWEESAESNRERFEDLETRLAVLAALNSDVEGLYRELDRSAERIGANESAMQAQFELLQADVVPGQQAVIADIAERVQLLSDRIAALGSVAADITDLQVTVGSVGEEASAAHQAALAAATEQLAIAARLRELDAVPVEIESIYRELDRVTGETVSIRETVMGAVLERIAPVERGVEQLRFDLDAVAEAAATQLGEVGQRFGAIEPAVAQAVGDIERISNLTRDALADMEGLRGELDRVSTEAQRVTALEPVVEQVRGDFDRVSEAMQGAVSRIESDFEGVHRELDRVSAEAQRVTALEPVVEQVRGDFDRVAGSLYREIGHIEDARSEQEGILTPLLGVVPELQDTVRALSARLETLSDDSLRSRIHEVTDPTEELVAQMAARVEAVMSELKAARSEAAAILGQSTPLTGAIDALRADIQRLRALEAVPEQVQDVAREVDTAVRRMSDRQEAELATASAAVQALEGRLAAIEALPAEMDGLYAALYGVAASLKDLGAEVPETMPAAPKLVGTRKVPARKPRSDQ